LQNPAPVCAGTERNVSDEALFEAEEATTRFVLYEDRIEVGVKKRRTVLPLAEVAEVLALRRPKRLVIVTDSGKHYEYLLGHEIEGARAAVTAQLGRLPAAR
jgi:hypothetical protein